MTGGSLHGYRNGEKALLIFVWFFYECGNNHNVAFGPHLVDRDLDHSVWASSKCQRTTIGVIISGKGQVFRRIDNQTLALT